MRLAASYARKSTHDDLGLAAQHAVNAEAALRDGFTIPDDPAYRFADDAVSGTTTRREALDRLGHLVKGGAAPFERVYVKDRTRLGRFDDSRYHAYLEVTFEIAKVPITYVNSIAGPATADPGQRMVHSVVGALEASIASEERRKLIERTTEGIRSRVISGRYPGTTTPYAMERWLVDGTTGAGVERVESGRPVRRAGCTYQLRWGSADEQAVVQRIFADVCKDLSLSGIARALNAEGIASPAGGPQACAGWSAPTVRCIATNPIYKGELVWGRTKSTDTPVPHTNASQQGAAPILYKDFIEPIVSAELWADAQAHLTVNGGRGRPRGQEPQFLLSGLLRCAHCHGGYFGFTSTKRYANRRSYYRHTARTNALAPEAGKCPAANRYFRSEPIDKLVLGVMNSLARDPMLQEAAREAFARDRDAALGSGVQRQLARHRARYEEIKGKMKRMVNARLEDPTLSAGAVFQEVTAAHHAELTGNEEAIRKLEGEQRLWEAAQGAIPTGGALITAALEGASPAERRQLVKATVGQVRLAPDRSTVEVELHPLA